MPYRATAVRVSKSTYYYDPIKQLCVSPYGYMLRRAVMGHVSWYLQDGTEAGCLASKRAEAAFSHYLKQESEERMKDAIAERVGVIRERAMW